MLGVQEMIQERTFPSIPELPHRINYFIRGKQYEVEIYRLMQENNKIGFIPFRATIEASIRTIN